MTNGLYIVTTHWFAFVVEGGQVVMCAPVLRRQLYSYWIKIAVRYDDES